MPTAGLSGTQPVMMSVDHAELLPYDVVAVSIRMRKSIITFSSFPFSSRLAERFIRYVKMQLWKRKELEGGWERQAPIVMKIYSTTPNVHSKLTPLQAHEDENALQQKLAFMMQAKKERTYPRLEVGDMVRIKVNKKAHDKEITSPWSKELYKVVFKYIEASGNTVYGLEDAEGQDIDNWFMRHELLKV